MRRQLQILKATIRRGNTTELHKLLDIDPYNKKARDKVDGDAIIEAAQKNPSSTEKEYKFLPDDEVHFPLHQAIRLGAGSDVIAALCSPEALQGRVRRGAINVLYLALYGGSSAAVVKVLIEKRHELVMENLSDEWTPLSVALSCKAPSEVVSVLVDAWPGALQQKGIYFKNMPLHDACDRRAAPDVILMLMNRWPGALRETNRDKNTPLHVACLCNLPLGVILPMLAQWPEATIQKNRFGKTPFDLIKKNRSAQENIKTLLSHVSAILEGKTDHRCLHEIVSFFVELPWWKGVMLVLDRYPLVVKTMDLPNHIMADFLSITGQHCKLTTMWEIICNEQNLLAGV